MDPIITGVLAGITGTFVMDSLNALFARTGMISRIDIGMLGRMSAGWAHRRFCYRNPGEVEQVEHERFLGYITHYIIGVGLALPYVFAWELFAGGPASPAWALAYGVATTVFSYLLVFPCMGLGVFGRRSPEGIKSPFSSLANHFFYGMGMAAVLTLRQLW